MKKNNFYIKLILFTLMISACGGDDLAINVEESKTITKSAMVLEQGFNFKDKASDPIGMGVLEMDMLKQESFLMLLIVGRDLKLNNQQIQMYI